MQDKPANGTARTSAAPGNHTNEADRVSHSTQREDEIVIPIVAEDVSVETARVMRGAVRVHKRVETTEQTVATPVVHEEVVVERVAIDRRIVEGAPPQPREENGTLVIPVLEEIAVVEKRLVL